MKPKKMTGEEIHDAYIKFCDAQGPECTSCMFKDDVFCNFAFAFYEGERYIHRTVVNAMKDTEDEE